MTGVCKLVLASGVSVKVLALVPAAKRDGRRQIVTIIQPAKWQTRLPARPGQD